MGVLPTIDWVAYTGEFGLPAFRAESCAQLASILDMFDGVGGPQLVVVPTPRKDEGVRAPYAPPAKPTK